MWCEGRFERNISLRVCHWRGLCSLNLSSPLMADLLWFSPDWWFPLGIQIFAFYFLPQNGLPWPPHLKSSTYSPLEHCSNLSVCIGYLKIHFLIFVPDNFFSFSLPSSSFYFFFWLRFFLLGCKFYKTLVILFTAVSQLLTHSKCLIFADWMNERFHWQVRKIQWGIQI